MSSIFSSIATAIGAKSIATKVAVGVLSVALVGGAGVVTYNHVKKNEEIQQARQEDIKDLLPVTVSEIVDTPVDSVDGSAELEEQLRKGIEETEKENERIMQENAKREAEEQAKKQSVQAIVDRDNERIRAAENNPNKEIVYADPELSKNNYWRSGNGEVATKGGNDEEWDAEDFYTRLNESMQRTLDKQLEQKYRRETGYEGELVYTPNDEIMPRETYERIYENKGAEAPDEPEVAVSRSGISIELETEE